jgi:hypothetical protein
MDTREQNYQSKADEALRAFQEGRIGFHEWNRLQREAVDEYTHEV